MGGRKKQKKTVLDVVESLQIAHIINGTEMHIEDKVVKEISVTLLLNDKKLGILSFTPQYVKELVTGFLYNEHYIKKEENISHIDYDRQRCCISISTTMTDDLPNNMHHTPFLIPDCINRSSLPHIPDRIINKPIKSGLHVQVTSIYILLSEIKHHTNLYTTTGGAHSAALCTTDSIVFSNEDIGRHNTIDKLIGWALINQISLMDKLVVTSARVSSSLIGKIIIGGIPILISRSAPTSAAVHIANEYGITLIGFAREKRMNIYSNEWRILSG